MRPMGEKRVTKASVRLGRWMAARGKSQAEVASEVTSQLHQLGWRGKPVNQSTVSSWVRGLAEPRALAMMAIHRLTRISPFDWAIPFDDPSVADDAAHVRSA